MGLIIAKLEDTATHVVAMSILVLNLMKILCSFFALLDWVLGLLCPLKNEGIFSRHYINRCVMNWEGTVCWSAFLRIRGGCTG